MICDQAKQDFALLECYSKLGAESMKIKRDEKKRVKRTGRILKKLRTNKTLVKDQIVYKSMKQNNKAHIQVSILSPGERSR